MSDFRTKLLGLAVLGMAMAGVSYGQVVTCPAGIQLASITAVIRAEGQTELVQDVENNPVKACTSTLATPGSVTITLTATAETLNPLLEITDTSDDEDNLSANYL